MGLIDVNAWVLLHALMFNAILVERDPPPYRAEHQINSMSRNCRAGDVTVRVEYSTLNYKDALAITGKGPVVRQFPDGARNRLGRYGGAAPSNAVLQERRQGAVERLGSRGDPLGRTRAAGARQSRLADSAAGALLRRGRRWPSAPPAIRPCCASWPWSGMASTPGDGEILVTGAAGGVGSVAVALLSKLGFRVAAMTGRPAEADFLRQLGAAEILDRAQFAARASRWPRNAGPARSTWWAAIPWPMSVRRCAMAAWSRPAVWPGAWIFRPPSRRSFCAASPWRASTASCGRAPIAWKPGGD